MTKLTGNTNIDKHIIQLLGEIDEINERIEANKKAGEPFGGMGINDFNRLKSREKELQSLINEKIKDNKKTEMQDITSPKVIEICISSDSKRVWINGVDGCIFRAYRIKKLILTDDR